MQLWMKAGDTVNIRVVAKGFLRCLYFGLRVFIGFSVWLAIIQACLSEFACENIYSV